MPEAPLLNSADLDINVTGHFFEYIECRLVGHSPSGKTRIYDVLSMPSRGSQQLGQIKWFGRWRQYAFFPYPNTIYSRGCLDDVAHFLVALEEARKRAR